ADAAVIDAMADNGVKLLALRCAGFNNVDLEAAKGKLPVVRVPAYSPYAVAEYSLALMLSLNRKIHRAYWRTRDGNFSLNGLMGFDMHGKTVGIIGTGKIAKILIRILKGLGMHILAYDVYPDYKFAEEEGITYTTLDELYKSSDIISLHCPLTEQTRYIINDDSIAKMKDGVMIINTGRGQLIHTNALIEGLKEKKISAAGLDVYEEEGDYFYEDKSDKIIDDDVLARLLSFNNVIVTSHQAFFTKEAMHNIAETTLQNIEDFRQNRPLVNEVIL
ncbi:MAG: 2-hydroxyacid dehydrogenase, partial [Parabacteroides sp.]|nr:2-hydroxyacid dehydrogenase [Parabacteroides sp.]